MSMQTVRTWPSAAFRFLRGRPQREIRSLLIVEQRAEVFARLASDLTSRGFFVERAETAHEACAKFSRTAADLILANRELSPDESGWLLVSKWALGREGRRVWLYTAWPTAFDDNWAAFTKVEQLLYYGGDLWQLSDRVLKQLGMIADGPHERRERVGKGSVAA